MHGWNIIYALINFAILAGGLFLIGRKIVWNAIRAHADQVSGNLQQSAASHENAKKLLEGIEGESAAGEAEREEILHQAEASAEKIRRAEGEKTQAALDKIALDAHKDLRRLTHAQRLSVNQKAAEEITAAAAVQIAKPENAEARARLSERFLTRLPEQLRITPGDLSGIRSRGFFQVRVSSSEALGERDLECIRAGNHRCHGHRLYEAGLACCM